MMCLPPHRAYLARRRLIPNRLLVLSRDPTVVHLLVDEELQRLLPHRSPRLIGAEMLVLLSIPPVPVVLGPFLLLLQVVPSALLRLDSLLGTKEHTGAQAFPQIPPSSLLWLTRPVMVRCMVPVPPVLVLDRDLLQGRTPKPKARKCLLLFGFPMIPIPELPDRLLTLAGASEWKVMLTRFRRMPSPRPDVLVKHPIRTVLPPVGARFPQSLPPLQDVALPTPNVASPHGLVNVPFPMTALVLASPLVLKILLLITGLVGSDTIRPSAILNGMELPNMMAALLGVLMDLMPVSSESGLPVLPTAPTWLHENPILDVARLRLPVNPSFLPTSMANLALLLPYALLLVVTLGSNLDAPQLRVHRNGKTRTRMVHELPLQEFVGLISATPLAALTATVDLSVAPVLPMLLYVASDVTVVTDVIVVKNP